MKDSKAPSAKVAVGAIAGLITLIVTSVLSATVPGWDTLSHDWQPFIDGGAAVLAYGVAAYWTTHQTTMTEFFTALNKAKAMVEAEATASPPINPPVPG